VRHTALICFIVAVLLAAPAAAQSPQAIVAARRTQYPTPLPADQILPLLRGIATDLPAAGVAGGPVGLLRKSAGHQCGGYSCDVLCAGQGSAQRQWDVLGDVDGAASPAWGEITGPKRIDVCEIVTTPVTPAPAPPAELEALRRELADVRAVAEAAIAANARLTDRVTLLEADVVDLTEIVTRPDPPPPPAPKRAQKWIDILLALVSAAGMIR
jgi:hypothetical protein